MWPSWIRFETKWIAPTATATIAGLTVFYITEHHMRPLLSIQPPAHATPSDGSSQQVAPDELFWKLIRESNTAAVFQEFLKRFPNSRYSEAAKNRITAQSGQRQPQTSAPAIMPLSKSAKESPCPAVPESRKKVVSEISDAKARNVEMAAIVEDLVACKLGSDAIELAVKLPAGLHDKHIVKIFAEAIQHEEYQIAERSLSVVWNNQSKDILRLILARTVGGKGGYVEQNEQGITFSGTDEGFSFDFNTERFDPWQSCKLASCPNGEQSDHTTVNKVGATHEPKFIGYSLGTKLFASNGAPLAWYYRDPAGHLELYDAPGYHPRSGEKLLPVTKEIAAELQRVAKECVTLLIETEGRFAGISVDCSDATTDNKGVCEILPSGEKSCL